MDWISKPYWLKVGLIYASILVLSSLLSYIPILNLIIDLIRTNLLPASFLEHPIRGFYQAKFVTLEPADYISSYNVSIILASLVLILLTSILCTFASVFISFVCKKQENFKQNIILSVIITFIFNNLVNILNITIINPGYDWGLWVIIYIFSLPISIIGLIYIIFKIIKIRKTAYEKSIKTAISN